jgi:hypothetical protein
MLNSELGSAGGATSSNGEATQGSMERPLADAMASEGNEMVVSGLVLADLDNGALELMKVAVVSLATVIKHAKNTKAAAAAFREYLQDNPDVDKVIIKDMLLETIYPLTLSLSEQLIYPLADYRTAPKQSNGLRLSPSEVKDLQERFKHILQDLRDLEANPLSDCAPDKTVSSFIALLTDTGEGGHVVAAHMIDAFIIHRKKLHTRVRQARM